MMMLSVRAEAISILCGLQMITITVNVNTGPTEAYCEVVYRDLWMKCKNFISKVSRLALTDQQTEVKHLQARQLVTAVSRLPYILAFESDHFLFTYSW